MLLHTGLALKFFTLVGHFLALTEHKNYARGSLYQQSLLNRLKHEALYPCFRTATYAQPLC